jgi:hypothetical protein
MVMLSVLRINIDSMKIIDLDEKIEAEAAASAKLCKSSRSNSSLGASALASAAVTSAKLGSSAVVEAAIASGAVTAEKLASDAVSTVKIASLAVTEAKLANGAVTANKLGAGAVTTSAISDGNVTTAKLAANAVNATKLDLTDTYDFSSGVVRVATTPSNDNDATSKSYVDNVAQGAHFKKAVQVAVESNIDLSSLPSTVDGQTLSSGDRFACIGQTDASENGIYTYAGSGSAASRASDMSEADEFPAAAFFVIKGTNGDKAYVCTNDTVNLGTTDITFTQFAGSGSSPLSFSGGLSKSGDSVTELHQYHLV